MEWGLAKKTLITGTCPMITVPINLKGRPCWLLEWAQRWQNLTMAHWQHINFDDESRFQLYLKNDRLRVRRWSGERFHQMYQASMIQDGGDSVQVWGVFLSGAKLPFMLPDRYLTGELYSGILQNTLVPFARQHFGDKYRCQNDNATPHGASVVLDFL